MRFLCEIPWTIPVYVQITEPFTQILTDFNTRLASSPSVHALRLCDVTVAQYLLMT